MPASLATSALSRQAREDTIDRLARTDYDVLVIGGGVTGAGAALDAASRGLTVALVEMRDWAAGLSLSVVIPAGCAASAVQLLGRPEALARAEPDAREALPAPGQTDPVRLPAAPPGVGTGLCRRRPSALRHLGRRRCRPTTPPPDPARRTQPLARHQARTTSSEPSRSTTLRSTTPGTPSSSSARAPPTVPTCARQSRWSGSGRRTVP